MSGTPVISDPVLLKADDWSDYELLDSGNGRKLERFGSQTTDRPDPQAFWAPNNPTDTWTADAVFSSSGDDERGNWIKANPKMPDDWKMGWQGLSFEVRRTPFRHLGVFQEHSVHWRHAQEKIRAAGRPIKLLNLFGYTGMMSLAAAQAGAQVTHLDASPKSNGYGKANQDLSGIGDKPIRWIADDALKFMRREVRRENTYDAIVLDPPKFGRGPKNETWRLEENLPELLELCRVVLSDQPLFVISTVYAVRLSYLALAQSLRDHLEGLGGTITTGEMVIPESSRDVNLPTAIFARWDASQ
ncbi:class I SAM-dependent methyltransferase [Ponticaulis sp.]|uniref:class I SAM-dependent methyltransferase n=1 Tax=Ponticaulis sp. TaxID=2020902 RepID=UPI000B6E9E66|nr:class I SAM-dependent methyltransferase [Ponticaulis sp.]MAI90441.1 SAM-dependent methyltransferase [Ponticaulis sp.]OUY00142.1 MAG: SAM-dependent methyltransferase [Hyphomonadaceae bacterium TMED5]|tara:strand:- start:56698 stop:57600 length:903 start_codon:yes stop_codon:yes gene_type:complete